MVIAGKNIFKHVNLFEQRTGYNIIIKKDQSVMLIEVINYYNKNVGRPSSKS